jgi:hypothetical protein
MFFCYSMPHNIFQHHSLVPFPRRNIPEQQYRVGLFSRSWLVKREMPLVSHTPRHASRCVSNTGHCYKDWTLSKPLILWLFLPFFVPRPPWWGYSREEGRVCCLFPPIMARHSSSTVLFKDWMMSDESDESDSLITVGFSRFHVARYSREPTCANEFEDRVRVY